MKHKIVITRDRPWFKAGIIAGSAFAIAVSGFALYRYTRATTVSDFERAQTEVEQLRDERRSLTRDLRAARTQIDQLKDQVVYAQRSGEIDSQACGTVKASLSGLQAEVADLREQLAFYRGIVSPDLSRAGVRVYEFKVDKSTTSNAYRYELVLIQSVRHDRQVGGRVQIDVEGTKDGAAQTFKLDDAALGGAKNLQFSFKYFEEFNGEFHLPAGFRPVRVVVTLATDQADAPDVKEQFDWDKVTKV
ncbi:MAG TPA: DUF6776 family protein [Nevskiaceae bacterium]|nr:DUF6776 family protein [Nevskiaceae bacterium]